MPKIAPVHFRKLLKVFKKAGFRVVREEGDHLILSKSGILRPVVIPKYSAIPVFIIKNNLRVAGMSREDYFRLL
jgi:predicted RNA binding protein YcfA (HicA-like mRNA interferase family)